MKIELRRLTEVESADLIDLMNQPRLRAFMPLLEAGFSESVCVAFVSGKESLWREHGYGPWGFFVDGHFAGWGGLQPEHGEQFVRFRLDSPTLRGKDGV